MSSFFRGATIRQRLSLIAIAAAIPMLLLTVVVVWQLTERERENNRHALMYVAHSISRAADAQLEKSVAIGQALAASPALDDADLSAFRREAERMILGLPGAWALLTDARGQILFNTLVPANQPLPRLTAEASANIARSFETKQSAVGNLTFGPVVKVPVVSVGMPVVRGDVPIYFLAIVTKATFFSDLLTSHQLPDDWLAGIIDRNGRFIARTLDNEQWVGKPASSGWRAVAKQEGWFEITSIEGEIHFVANTVSSLSGWAIGTALKKSAFEGPIRSTIVTATLAGLAVTLLAILLASWAARKITTPIRMLERGAEALRNHVPISVSFAGVPEVDSALRVFGEASAQLIANEKALRDSETRFRHQFENNVAVLLVIDPESGAILDANPAAAAFYGWSHDELCSKHITDINVLHSAELAVEMAGARSGEKRHFEFRHRLKDGSIRDVDVYSGPVPFEGRSVLYSIIHDVTERRQAEDALRESEERLRHLGDNLPDSAVYQYARKPDGTPCFHYISSGIERLNGVSAEDVLRDAGTLYRQIASEYMPVLIEGERQSARDLTDFNIDVPMRRPDGEIRWMRMQSRPRRLADGQVVWDGVQSDITERKQAEEALRASEERFRAYFDTAAVGITEITLDGTYLQANRRFCDIVGYSRDELLHMTWFDLTHPEDRLRDAPVRSAFLAGKSAIFHSEKRYIRKDGHIVWVEVTASLIRDAEGKPLRSGGIVQDITDRKRVQEELRENEKRVRALEADLLRASRLSEIGNMAAALAHELNQPLTAVTSYMGGCRRILNADVEEEARRQKLLDVMEKANSQALRAGDIIRRLREFVGTGDSQRIIEEAAIVMHEACTLAMATARHVGVSVHLDFDKAGRILVDKIQFQQVLANLVRNAVEAMENTPRKEIEIGLAARGDRVEFSVSDTGSGIPAEMIDRLFTPFSSTKPRGMGIGLSVCREIVEAHGGKIWAEPGPGTGTVLRFTLPVVDETIASERMEDAASARAPLA